MKNRIEAKATCYPGEFPDCGCHYTIDDDGIHFYPMHNAAPAMLQMYEDLLILMRHNVSQMTIEELIKATIKMAKLHMKVSLKGMLYGLFTYRERLQISRHFSFQRRLLP